MQVGIPKEIKVHESRVAITPDGVSELVRAGHDVYIETGAGLGSAITDADFTAHGAKILATADDVWNTAELILKVKEPIEVEYARIKSHHTLFTYLHLAASKPCTDALIASGCAAIAYETVEKDGQLPLLAPMSEVAGRMATQVGAYSLQKPNGGRGVLLAGVPGVAPGKVVVIGGGVAGLNAAVIAMGMGADVTVLDRSIPRMQEIDSLYGGRIKTLFSAHAAIEREVLQADLIIGAVLVHGAKAPKLVSNELVSRMKHGSVLVDIAIDQGGCIETIRPTSHKKPVYTVHGVIHYAVPNMPALVGRTSTQGLTQATEPYVALFAENGIERALSAHKGLAQGVNTRDGKITCEAVAHALR